MRLLVKPNEYVLGGNVRLKLFPLDQDDDFFVPNESRLSIKQPDGVIVTVSGSGLTTASGYLYYRYKPPTIGWYEYESWVKDSAENEDVQTNGFEVTDRVY